jgi:hypothetical protein
MIKSKRQIDKQAIVQAIEWQKNIFVVQEGKVDVWKIQDIYFFYRIDTSLAFERVIELRDSRFEFFLD